MKVVRAASKGSKRDAGFVDVWKRGFFAWEYKAKDKHKTLDEAYRQLYQYRDNLDNPPLSVVCDIRTTEIRAHCSNQCNSDRQCRTLRNTPVESTPPFT